MEEIVNKVQKSGLIQIDLEDLRPKGERVFFDLEPLLYMGLALREKDFREFIQSHDWDQYTHKHIAIGCTSDAIIPTWAYMLVSSKLADLAASVVLGSLKELEDQLYLQVINQLDLSPYIDGKIVV